MERQLSEITERIIKLETAQEFRYQATQQQHMAILVRLETIHFAVHRSPPLPNGNGYTNRNGSGWGWVKIPTALVLPILVFFLILTITGDLRSALNAARGAG